MVTLPISAVVPTCNRPLALQNVLQSLAKQGVLPAELIIVDGSKGTASRNIINNWASIITSDCAVLWQPAEIVGAANQRNQGVAAAAQPLVWFFDDDILFEPDCVSRLWRAIESDAMLGGVNAMIVNQQYHPPRFVSRTIFTLMHGKREKSFAGRVIGPAINLLPEDREDLPELVPVEWLNLGCTIYRREALPSPPFDAVFKGYSLMEDLTLSLRVGKQWKLANVRNAKIFHDSQAGEHKRDTCMLGEMELLNRHYIMTKVLLRHGAVDYLKLLGWELFQLTACAVRSDTRKLFLPTLQGKFRAARQLVH